MKINLIRSIIKSAVLLTSIIIAKIRDRYLVYILKTANSKYNGIAEVNRSLRNDDITY